MCVTPEKVQLTVTKMLQFATDVNATGQDYILLL